MKTATYAGGAVGVLLLVGLAIHTDLYGMLHALQAGGWALAWLLPYRALFFALYAFGWLVLLLSANAAVVSFGYVFWVTSVREAVDRLLPVASVGGAFLAVRLMRWRGLDSTAVGATIVTEILLTLIVSYLFAAMGLLLLAHGATARQEYRNIFYTLALSLPVLVVAIALLRDGSALNRLERYIERLLGRQIGDGRAMRLALRVKMVLRDRFACSLAGILEAMAVISGCFEVWFAMRLFQHRVTVNDALILESMTVTLRHIAFVVPAGLGVQEAGLVVFGRALGIDSDIALAVSMVKRARELLWGIPCLISWQWLEGRRLVRENRR